MIQTLKQMQQIPIGFKKDHLLTMLLSLPEQKYSDGRSIEFTKQLMQQIGGLPSIQSVAVASDIPFGGSVSASIVTTEEVQAQRSRRIYRHSVSPNFFATLGIPIINGRAFSDRDTAEAPPVAIVSKQMAEKFWGDQNPIGKRIKFGGSDSKNPWITVAGVVSNAKHRTLINDPLLNPDDPDLYLPLGQREELSPALVIRTTQNPVSMNTAVKQEIQKNGPRHSCV